MILALIGWFYNNDTFLGSYVRDVDDIKSDTEGRVKSATTTSKTWFDNSLAENIYCTDQKEQFLCWFNNIGSPQEAVLLKRINLFSQACALKAMITSLVILLSYVVLSFRRLPAPALVKVLQQKSVNREKLQRVCIYISKQTSYF